MSLIRITREFSFEMAHALEGYDGACRQIHGHSYRLFVTVQGNPSADPADPKCGMVMDFGILKALVNRVIISQFDHTLAMRRHAENTALLAEIKTKFPGICEFDFQPTCENLTAHFAALIGAELPAGVRLYSVRLHETAASFAEWFAEDNA